MEKVSFQPEAAAGSDGCDSGDKGDDKLNKVAAPNLAQQQYLPLRLQKVIKI